MVVAVAANSSEPSSFVSAGMTSSSWVQIWTLDQLNSSTQMQMSPSIQTVQSENDGKDLKGGFPKLGFRYMWKCGPGNITALTWRSFGLKPENLLGLLLVGMSTGQLVVYSPSLLNAGKVFERLISCVLRVAANVWFIIWSV